MLLHLHWLLTDFGQQSGEAREGGVGLGSRGGLHTAAQTGVLQSLQV